MIVLFRRLSPPFFALAFVILCGCSRLPSEVSPPGNSHTPQKNQSDEVTSAKPVPKAEDLYAEFTLTGDLSPYSDKQKKMIGLLIDAAVIMDDLFWQQAWGDKAALLNEIERKYADNNLKKLVAINYGPWDRLNGDKPFLPEYGEKPLGARFYPADMSKKEFEAAQLPDKTGLYTLLRRDSAGQLVTVPYHQAYAERLKRAADLLRTAAQLAEDPGFATYLNLRADALQSDDFRASDLQWLDTKTNPIDIVIGPIETYEDQLFGYKAAYEAYVLLKDRQWSKKLARFSALLPALQQGLPVADKYKQEKPGTDSDLNAYDVVYYAGHSNAGSKTIAINLPNDEVVQLAKGTRRLQLKNAMRAKFDKILLPIADIVIAPDQRKHVTFDAFFANTMFHEVAHGLGIKNTVNGKGPVRTALKELASATEEGKADILGLYMVEKLLENGEINEGELMDYYTTFLAGIFRSIRFGSSSAHGVANRLRFNYFADQGAFEFDPETRTYRVNPEAMHKAIAGLSEKILTLQGEGDYAGTKQWFAEKGNITPALQKTLDRIAAARIPVDITFRQGKAVLGLDSPQTTTSTH